VGLGGLGETLTSVLLLIKSCWVAKVKGNSFTKVFLKPDNKEQNQTFHSYF